MCMHGNIYLHAFAAVLSEYWKGDNNVGTNDDIKISYLSRDLPETDTFSFTDD